MTAPDGKSRSFIDSLEETLIALLLGLMTLITFANVVARQLDSNILWALEATVYLFAWLILLGASYGVKQGFHIGVDVFIRLFPVGTQRVLALIAVVACLAFSLLLLKGGWDYWWAFMTKRSFYEVNDIPMPGFLQFLADWMNDGERYEKIPRFIPYAVLPLSMALLAFRFLQLVPGIWRGERLQIIESQDVEDLAPPAAGDTGGVR